MMTRRSGWGWIRIRTTRENTVSAQDRRIRFHPKCNLLFLCRRNKRIEHRGYLCWLYDQYIDNQVDQAEELFYVFLIFFDLNLSRMYGVVSNDPNKVIVP